MRMFFYYVLHTLKNQIRKLFKTWVAIFLVVCFAMGLLFGGLGAMLDEAFPEEELPEDEYEETLPDEEFEEEFEEVPMTEEEILTVVEVIASGLAFLLLLIPILGADKSGNAIFLPADIPTLFSSPMRPQSVLLFRLLMQSSAFLWVGFFYFGLQIPNLSDTGRTNTDIHFHKVGTGQGKERNLSFTSHCLCKQCLTGTRRAHK